MGERRREALLSCGKDKEHCCMLLKSLKNEFATNLGEFRGNNSKKLVAGVTEVLQELNQKQFDAFWKDIFKLAFEALGNLSSLISKENQMEGGDQMDTDDGSSVEVLEMICILLLAVVRLEELVATSEMIQTLNLLHGSLFDLHDIKASFSACICTICVEWWNKKLPSREYLCLNVMTLLLRMLFQFNKHDKLTAVCSIQDCLSLFDFKRPTASAQMNDDVAASEAKYAQSVTEELRKLLINSFRYASLLGDKSGRKFLSFVLLLHKDLMKDVHQSLMDAIGHKFSLLQAEALGSVYFQSWRSAGEEMKESVEEICIQDLMFKAARAPCAKNQNSFDPLRAMLFSIVCHKTSLEVRHMIARLYSPIIWRSLKANNSMVRANASELLLDAFPMEGEDSNKAKVVENEEFMQRQYDALNNMLMDNCARIRVIGIIRLCEILHNYWDAIPAHVIAILTRKLYNDLAFDATVDVRQAVFKGTITLLDTPCAHPLLAKLLPPCMEKCLHDVSEKVRIIAADVLLAVKQTSTISFWSVCPVPNIIAQLEIDGNPVSKRLTKLLFRSFVPEDKSVQVWVERCVNFFKRNVNAARKFYSLIDKDLTEQEIGEFLNMIGIFLYNCVTRALQEENSLLADPETSSVTSSSAVNTDAQLNNSPIEEDVLAAVLDASCILWMSLDNKKTEKNRGTMKKVMTTFSRTIHVCFKLANDERTLNALMLLSSNLPPASLPVFSKGIIPKLRSLPDDAPSSYYGMLIKCICSWNWTKQLLELVNEWLVEATSDFGTYSKTTESEIRDRAEGEKTERSETPRVSRSATQKENEGQNTKSRTKKKKKKVVMFTGVQQQLRPSQALKYINAFLQVQASCSFTALDKENSLQILITISKTLGKCQDEVLKLVSSSNTSTSKIWSDSLLIEALNCRYKLLSIIHLHQKSKISDDASGATLPDIPLQELQLLTEWFCQVLMQHQLATKAQADLNSSIISNEAATSSLLARLSFYRQIFSSTLLLFFDFLSCGIEVFDEVENSILQFCESDMNLVEYVGILLKILHQLHEHKVLTTCVPNDSDGPTIDNDLENGNQLNSKMVEIFDNLLTTLLQHARRTPESFTQLFRQDLRQMLRTLVKEQNLMHSCHPEKTWYHILIKKSASAVLADLFHDFRSSQHFLSRSLISEFPEFTAAILPTICATAAETAFVCENAILPLAAEESSEQMLLIFALLLHVLSQDGKNKTIAETSITTLRQTLTGFDAALLKVQNGQGSPCKTEPLSSVPLEHDEVGQNQNEEGTEEEPIQVLENSGPRDMFMNDEDLFVL